RILPGLEVFTLRWPKPPCRTCRITTQNRCGLRFANSGLWSEAAGQYRTSTSRLSLATRHWSVATASPQQLFAMLDTQIRAARFQLFDSKCSTRNRHDLRPDLSRSAYIRRCIADETSSSTRSQLPLHVTDCILEYSRSCLSSVAVIAEGEVLPQPCRLNFVPTHCLKISRSNSHQ